MQKQLDDLKKEISELRAQLEIEKTNYEHVCQNSGDGILVTNILGNILYANPSACQLFKKNKNDLIGSDFGQPVLNSNKTELDIVTNPSTTVEMKVSKSFWESNDAYIITLHDVTQRKHQEQSLIAERDYFNNLIYSAPSIVVVLDTRGFPIQMNKFAEHITGFKLKDFKEEDWFSKTVPNEELEKVISNFNKVINQKKSQDCIQTLIHKRGESHTIHWSCSPIYNDTQKLIGVLSIGYDITINVKEQNQLRSSEEKLRGIFEHSPFGIFQMNYKGELIFLNTKFAQLLGFYTPKEVFEYAKKYKLQIFEHPESQKRILEFTLQNQSVATFRQRLFRKNGKNWLSKISLRAVKTPEGKLSHFEGFVDDISHRTQMENELIRSNKRYQRMASNINAMIYQAELYVDQTIKFLYISPKITDIYEIEPHEAYNNPDLFKQFYSKSDFQQMIDTAFKSVSKLTPMQWESWVVTKSGKRKWVFISQTFEKTNHGSILTDGIIFDLSERKIAEEALKKSQLSLTKSQAVALLGNWEWDFKTDEVTWSDQMFEIYDVSPEITPSKDLFLTIVHPDDIEKILDQHKQFQKKRPIKDSATFRIIRKNGETRYIKSILELSYKNDTEITTIFGTDQDITQIVLGQKALEDSTTQYKRLAENVPGMVYQYRYYHNQEYFDYISPNCKKILEIEPERLIQNPSSIISLFVKEDIPSIRKAIETSFRSLKNLNWAGRIVTPAGKIKWIQCLAQPVLLDSGALIWEGIILDITETKKQEERITLLSTAVEQSANCIVMTNLNGEVEYINPKFTEITGYTLDEILGKKTNVLRSGFHSDRFYKELWDTINRGKVWKGEFKNRNKYGHFYWESATITPVKNTEGKIVSFMAIKENITKQKKAETEVRESKNLLSSIYETINTGICLTYPNGTILQVNTAFCNIIGYSHNELLKQNILDFIPPEYQTVIQEIHNKALNGEHTSVFELYIYNKNYKKITLQLCCNQIEKTDNSTILLTSIFDISERKKAETKLKQSEESFSAIFESIEAGVILVDYKGTISKINHAIQKIYQYTPEELINKHFEILIPKNHCELYKERFKEFVKSDQQTMKIVEQQEPIGLKKDGSVFPFEMSLSKVHVKGEHQIAILLTDITERKQIQNQLLRSQRMESIGLLASGIAHDMNNIMTPIVMSTELIEDFVIDDMGIKRLDVIKRSSNRAKQLIQQLLSFAKGQNDQKIPVNLRRIILEIVSFISETFSRSIKIQHDIDPKLHYVLADPTQLHQAILNLCVNAHEAMPNGGVLQIIGKEIELDSNSTLKHIDAKPGNYVLIQIQDTGTGISREHLQSIFEPFFTTKDQSKGTGLGLTMVYNITKNHEGFLDVQSKLGEGSTFNLYLPVFQTESQQNEPIETKNISKGNGKVILVVDDERDIREITSQILNKNDYIPICAPDGIQALNLYREHQDIIDGALVDLMMPVMDGFETIAELRKLNKDLKIMAVSGLIDSKTFAEKSSVKVNALLNKTYSSDMLLIKLNEIFA